MGFLHTRFLPGHQHNPQADNHHTLRTDPQYQRIPMTQTQTMTLIPPIDYR